MSLFAVADAFATGAAVAVGMAMLRKSTLTVICCASIAMAGCAHHHVGRPPSAGEIADIDDAADLGVPGAMRLAYGPPGGTPDAPAPVRPIPDGAPLEIERIVSAADGKLAVVDPAGQPRTVDLSLLQGVATSSRRRCATRFGVTGGLIGLGLSGFLALSYNLLKGAPDQPVTSYAAANAPAPVATEVGLVVGSVALGALLGALIGHHNPTYEQFDFGDVGR